MMSGGFLLGVSILAGLVGAVSGVGGGVVLIPVLTYCGIDIKRAIALSLLSVVAVSNSAASTYLRRHLPNLKANAFLGLFAVIGSLVGASITLASGRRSLFVICGGIMLLSGLVLWKRRKEDWTPSPPLDAGSQRLVMAGSYYDYTEKRTIHYRARGVAIAGPLMFGTGLVSGWLGFGSSALTVLVQDLVMGLPPKVSLTTSNLVIGVMALAGTSVYLEAGLIDPRLAVFVILGVPLGAWIGSKVFVGLTNRVVRIVFLAVVIIFGVEMIAHGVRGV